MNFNLVFTNEELQNVIFQHYISYSRTAGFVTAAQLRAHGQLSKHLAGHLLLLLLKQVGSARLRESDIHPISPKTPAPQYQPIDRKKRKAKIVEDYSRDRAA